MTPITYNVLLNSNYINKSGGLAPVPFTRNGSTFSVTAPQTLGVWKVYVFAEDGKGNVGVETRSVRVVPPAVDGTNIAKGRPATASSFDPYNGNFTPGQATDGDYATRWSSNWTDDEWIQVDLGSQTGRSRRSSWSGSPRSARATASRRRTTGTPGRTLTDGHRRRRQRRHRERQRQRALRPGPGTARGTAYGYSLYELGVYA